MRKPHPCKNCRYWYGSYDGSRCCNYIFDIGKPRPCPPGDACTVRIEKELPEESCAQSEKSEP